MLIIHNEELARRLEAIATNEHRSVDDVLETLLDTYPVKSTTQNGHSENDDDYYAQAMVRLTRNAYENARQYWQETGNTDRLALSLEQFDEAFWLFDSEGIPRLKSEKDQAILVPGTTAYAAAFLEKMPRSAYPEGAYTPIDPRDADDILNAEFADYLLARMNGNDDVSTDSD
jgi:hypothetical protein